MVDKIKFQDLDSAEEWRCINVTGFDMNKDTFI